MRKINRHWKNVKTLHAEQEVILRVPVVSARCATSACPSFQVPIPGIARYARSTERLRQEAVAGLIQDNSTLQRVAKRLHRSFNVTGSKSSVDRWKQEAAGRWSQRQIL